MGEDDGERQVGISGAVREVGAGKRGDDEEQFCVSLFIGLDGTRSKVRNTRRRRTTTEGLASHEIRAT